MEKKEMIKEEELFIASQWQLVRLKFMKHRLAMGAIGVLSVLYFSTIFAEFISPYDPRIYDADKLFCPPQRLHFFDETGSFNFRPFVYQINLQIDPITFRKNYVIDKTKMNSLYFFVGGSSYKLWGLFEGNIHFFGIKQEKICID